MNNKIYVSITAWGYPNNVYDTIIMNLSVINNPDSLGTACNFAPYSFNLSGKRAYPGLPNIPNYGLSASFTFIVDSAKAGNDTTICQYQNVIIRSPAKAGCIYSWSPSTSLDDSTKAQPVASPTKTTTYILTLIDNNNAYCKYIATTTDTIVVQVIPFEKASAGTNSRICLGDSVEIGIPIINGYAYTWHPSIALNDSLIPQPLTKTIQTTTYIMTMMDTTNTACKNLATTAEVVVNVNNCFVNKIYPSPANENIIIEYNIPSGGTFQIYDVLGQKVISTSLKGFYMAIKPWIFPFLAMAYTIGKSIQTPKQ